MLEINDVNICYNQKAIIQNGHAEFYCGYIHGIIGKSGCGKTSVVKGIISMYNDMSITYNQEPITEQNKSFFIKNHVFYVDQYGSCLPNMTVYQHFQYYSEMKKEKIDKNIIEGILKKFNLESIPVHQKVNDLSVGERKRFLIALGLYSEKDIIILDEPSASLDQQNRNLLKSFLKELNHKTVIITTHDQDFFEMCDIIYEIDNHKLNLIKTKEHSESIQKVSKSYSFYPLKYMKYKNMYMWLKQCLTIILYLFICMQLSIGLKNNIALSMSLSENSQVLNENMIYLRYRYGSLGMSYIGGNYEKSQPLSELMQDEIKSIQGVTLKPYTFLYNYTNSENMKEVTVYRNEQEINIPDESYDTRGLCVAPSFDENGNHVIISESMAKRTGIQVNDVVKTSIYIPTYQYIYQEEDSYRFLSYKCVDVEFKIDKIEGSSQAYYNPYTKDMIYIPYEQCLQYLTQYNGDRGMMEPYDKTLQGMPYQINDYFVFCEKDKVNEVYQQLVEMNENYDVFSNAVFSLEAQQSAQHTQKVELITMIVISGVSIFAFSIVVYWQFISRKKERQLLSYQGITSQEIGMSYYYESLIHAVVCMIVFLIAGFLMKSLLLTLIAFVVIAVLIIIECVIIRYILNSETQDLFVSE